MLVSGEFGNYQLIPERQVILTDTVSDIVVGPRFFLITLENSDMIVKIPVEDGIVVLDEIEYQLPIIRYAEQMNAGAGIAFSAIAESGKQVLQSAERLELPAGSERFH